MNSITKLVAAKLAAAACLGAVITGQGQVVFTKITEGPVVSDSAASFGAAWVDFDADGDLDLYVSNANGPNLLYRNDGRGGFTKVTDNAIVTAGSGSRSASWADVNNDGRPDLYVARSSTPGWLFLQQPDGSFSKSSVASSSSQGAAWGDYDRDGFVDLLVTDSAAGAPLRSDGQGHFTVLSGPRLDVSGDAIAWVDYDADGDPDVFVAEGTFSGGGVSRLYRNDGAGVFTRITSGELAQRSTFASGVAWADYINDGYLDVFLPRAGDGQNVPSFLFHNNGDGSFSQYDREPFTTDIGFAVSASWADYDNDGWLDLFVSERGGAPNRLYRNDGNGGFTRVMDEPFGTDPGQCAGSTWGDYDRDGFLDLFVSTSVGGNGPQPDDYLYHNNGNTNAWLSVKCAGTQSNRSGIGAKVRATTTIAGKRLSQLREINTGDGWARNALEAHFGLGNATNVEMLRIDWPSGTVQELRDVPARQSLTVFEPARMLSGHAAGTPQFAVQGGRELRYKIETSDDLRTWLPLAVVTVTAPEGNAPIVDPNAPAAAQRFYRAVLQ